MILAFWECLEFLELGDSVFSLEFFQILKFLELKQPRVLKCFILWNFSIFRT